MCEAAIDHQEYSVEEHVKELEIQINDTIAKIDIEYKELRETIDEQKDEYETLNQKMNRVDDVFKCPLNGENYRSIDNKCFYVDTTLRNYDDAKQNCNTKFSRAKLFEPKSSTTRKRVHQMALSITNAGFWLGINDKRSEGSWVYDTDETSVTFSIPWYPGEPNGGRGQNCLMYWNPSQIGQLSDLACKNSYLSICEQVV